MRGRGDGEVGVGEVVAGAHEGQRLDRLRRAPQEAGEARVTRGGDDLAVADGDRVHPVSGFHRPVPAHLDDDGAHGAQG